ncbi:S41 family peptidase [Niabella yanshanensis]|uniref:S41 family peptidase n=1 Tax=Niabella yanshanensis TaxID=577386 RepID=A0ABZ0W1E3_9BACT|nr:S41 family peptidase [Niabella yanshanensis]WQD37027.1 S41 family peptidase [Niabella yanshanensis]
MRTLLYVAILLLLFFDVAGQAKFSQKELLHDLSVLKRIVTNTNPLLTNDSRVQMERMFADAERTFPLEQATGLEFIKYVTRLQINAGYDEHASFDLNEQLFPVSSVFFPVPIYLLGDRFVVNSEKAMLPYGSLIRSINGISADSILHKFLRGDREVNHFKHRLGSIFHAMYFLEYGGADEFIITYNENLKSKELKTVTCKAVSLRNAFALQNDAVFPLTKVTEQNLNQTYVEFNEITKGYYLQLKSFTGLSGDSSMPYTQMFDSLFKHVQSKSPRSMILDIRGNSGGLLLVPGLLLSYLAGTPFDEVHHLKMMPVKDIPLDYLKRIDQRPVATKSDGRKMLYRLYDGSVTQNGSTYKDIHFKREPSPYRFSGPVALLTDGGTFSAAAYFANLFQRSKRGSIMGLPTGGAARQITAGHMLEYELPNTKIVVSLPLMYITFGDAASINSTWDYVVPDAVLPFEKEYQYFCLKQDWGVQIKLNAQ